MRKSFILGLGAQKAGTTWFYEYLKSDPKSAMGTLKEYHVWDALHIPCCRNFLQIGSTETLPPKKILRRQLQSNERDYFNYFENLVRDPDKQITADITPSYSGLQRNVLRLIRQGFENRGMNCNAVFFMRDPVDRCWSFVRMLHSRNDRRVMLSSSLEDLALRYARTKAASIRTRYEQILPEIEAAFPRDQVYIGFYETMFTPHAIVELSQFLGLQARPNFVEKKFNVSADAVELSDEAKSQLAKHFRSTYEFAASRYSNILTLWKNIRYLDL